MIFSAGGFEQGKWAGNLAQHLRKRKIIPDLAPKVRVWRATWNQWIQFEKPGFNGPAFWLGKPAVLSSEDMLYVGYYVERGLQVHDNPDYQISDGWHWKAFINCLQDENYRLTINAILMNLPEHRRCIWIRTDRNESFIEYKGVSDLSKIRAAIESIPKSGWMEVILGVFFSKKECLDLQEKIQLELISPILRASEILSYVNDVRNAMKQ